MYFFFCCNQLIYVLVNHMMQINYNNSILIILVIIFTLMSLTHIVIIFCKKKQEKYQLVNVKQAKIRILTTEGKNIDIIIRGKALYNKDIGGILVEEANQLFFKWRENAVK